MTDTATRQLPSTGTLLLAQIRYQAKLLAGGRAVVIGVGLPVILLIASSTRQAHPGAADIAGYDAHLVTFDTEPRGDTHPGDVNALRRRDDRHGTSVRVVTRDAAASLHGHVLVPVHVDVEVDKAISGRERAGDVAVLAARGPAGDVVT